MSQEPDDLEDLAGAGCGDSLGSSQPGPGESQDELRVPGFLQRGSSQLVPGGSLDESQVSGTSL